MKTMYCFRVAIENEVATPVTDVFLMSIDEYFADPASDFDYTQDVPAQPTLWGYETYAVAEQIRRNQMQSSWFANVETAGEKARQYEADQRKSRLRYA